MSTTITRTEKKKKVAPKLRFNGFTDEWSDIRLSDLTSLITKGTTPQAFAPEGINYVKIEGLVGVNINKEKCLYIDEETHQKELRRSILQNQDILFAIAGATIGKVAIVTEDILPANTNQALAIIRLTNKENLFYLLQILQSRIMKKYIQESISVGAQPNLNLEQMGNFKFHMPSSLEQQKIASFLSSVDEKIQQLTRKKELLSEYKKGVMQQVYSGKLRFKDEKGKAFPKWEEKRLDEVISKFIVPMRDKPKDLTGPIPWCRIEDFDGKYLSKSKSGQGVNLATIKEMNLKVYPIGTLLVSCSANLGFCAITKTELMTNQTFIGLVPDVGKVDVLFLLYVMRRSSVLLNTLSSGTTISYLSREQFEKFKIPYPNLSEQKKLAGFISFIDDKIDYVNEQITQTQIFKKGLLQQMFV